MRLDKLLAHCGLGSRKAVKQIIRQGAVTIDNQCIKKEDLHVEATQVQIRVNGTLIHYVPYLYIMLHKPSGVVSATEDNVHKTVIDLIDAKYAHYKLFPVGRLDKDTEGLLLITNDGELAHQLLAPIKKVPKKYIAYLKCDISDDDITYFKEGVVLEDGTKCKPAMLALLDKTIKNQVVIEVVEGKFHQVKRMAHAIDNEVLYLKRVSMASLELDASLKKGDYRFLTTAELEQLKAVKI